MSMESILSSSYFRLFLFRPFAAKKTPAQWSQIVHITTTTIATTANGSPGSGSDRAYGVRSTPYTRYEQAWCVCTLACRDAFTFCLTNNKLMPSVSTQRAVWVGCPGPHKQLASCVCFRLGFQTSSTGIRVFSKQSTASSLLFRSGSQTEARRSLRSHR